MTNFGDGAKEGARLCFRLSVALWALRAYVRGIDGKHLKILLQVADELEEAVNQT